MGLADGLYVHITAHAQLYQPGTFRASTRQEQYCSIFCVSIRHFETGFSGRRAFQIVHPNFGTIEVPSKAETVATEAMKKKSSPSEPRQSWME